MKNAITDVPGIRVGHAQDEQALTGCTVVLCEQGAVGGVDQRGGAPGTRETDALRPMHLVDQVHAVVLTGGSAFGLDAASGVMRYLDERSVGYDAGVARVPIVPAAVLFDLALGAAKVRPDAAMGYQACLNASDGAPAEGNCGAGTGATVGKIMGMAQAMKSGVGTASLVLAGGLIVGALVAVNALGDVMDVETGQILAGALVGQPDLQSPACFANSLDVMKKLADMQSMAASQSNTTIGVVATNARLTREGANKVAQMAQDGLARSIYPAHTMWDGDTIFTLATGEQQADVSIVGALAAEVFARAVVRAVLAAQPAGGLPAVGSLRESREAFVRKGKE